MPSPLSGPGLGLQIPTNLYPSELVNAPYDYGTNTVGLNAGDEIPVPAGTWYISLGMYLIAEFLDPVTNIWTFVAAGTQGVGAPLYVKSDGFNWRIANRLACPVGGIVLTGGSGYVQASTTATASSGTSLWIPIVGGALTPLSVTGGFGAGYGVPPILIIPSPPPPANNVNGVGGRQAVGYAVISGGSVSTVSLIDQGAGYPSSFTVTLLPNPTDPNINTGITLSQWSFSTVFAGSITGIVCTNPGNPIATPAQLSLTIAGAGTNATVAPVMLQTLTSVSVSVGGLGYGLAGNVMLTTAGGAYPGGSIAASPELLARKARPRPANVTLAVSGANGSIAAQSGAIVDGGLFFQQGNNGANTASVVIIPGASAGTAGSILGPAFVNTFGGSNVFDIAVLQPAP
jgi:hypothetical protein